MKNTATFWSKILAPDEPWETAYPIVAKHVRKLLETDYQAPLSIDTTTLGNRLFPKEDAETGEHKAARARLYSALKALARHDLAACARKGRARKGSFGKIGRPTLWSSPVLSVNDL